MISKNRTDVSFSVFCIHTVYQVRSVYYSNLKSSECIIIQSLNSKYDMYTGA